MGRSKISDDSSQKRIIVDNSLWKEFEEKAKKTGQRPMDMIREFIFNVCHGTSGKFTQRRIPVDDSIWEEFTEIAKKKKKLPMDMIKVYIHAVCCGITAPIRRNRCS